MCVVVTNPVLILSTKKLSDIFLKDKEGSEEQAIPTGYYCDLGFCKYCSFHGNRNEETQKIVQEA